MIGAERGGSGWDGYFDGAARGLGDSEAANAYVSVRNFRFVRDRVLEWIGPVRGAKVLDAGCGTGHFAAALAAGNEIVGLDLSEAMLRLACGRGLRPVRASAAALPFGDGAFDLVLANSVIQLLPDGEAFVRELLRVTRPGGRAVVTTINAGNILIPVLRIVERRKYRGFRIYGARALREIAARAGGTVESTLFLAYPFGWSRSIPGSAPPPAVFSRLATSFAISIKKLK